MDSIIAKIGILVEVFAAGVMLWIANIFIHNYFLRGKKPKDFLLFSVFMAFFMYLALTFISQIYYAYDQPIPILTIFYRLSGIALAIGSLFVVLSANSRSKIKGDRSVIVFLVLVFFFLLLLVATSPFTLLYEGGNFEPRIVINNLPFFGYDLTRTIFYAVWFLFGLISFLDIFLLKKDDVGQKILYFFDAISSFLFVVAYLLIICYLNSKDSVFFLLSNVSLLLGGMGIGLGEAIDPQSRMALNPFNYFRSRLLFKIIFGFTLIIIILFGGTNIVAIEMNKAALKKTVFNRYETIASEVAAKIDAQKEFSSLTAFKIISGKSVGRSGTIYVVNGKGELIAKPAAAKINFKQNLAGLYPVKNLLGGNSGSGEYFDLSSVLVVGAYKSLENFRGGVVVEESARDAYVEIRKLETDLLVNVIAGMVLTLLITFYFAGTIEKPLKLLRTGTDAVSAGDLNYHIKIRSIDEFGELAHAYNRMTSDLKETQNRLILSEKMISLGNMAAGMAHEIRNPLVSLRTFTQLLASQWENKEFRDKFLAIVPREIERINRIAESLLKFGRPWKAEIKEVDIRSVLDEVLLLFEPEMKKRGVVLKTKITEVPKFMGDAPQLVQAFTNIIKNALEAMGDKGGGDLLVETEYVMALKLKEHDYSPNEMTWGEKIEEKAYIVVRITDTGGGIPKGKLRNLFDPFFTSKTYGTGMGLPITLRIIEEHKGTIKVKSIADQGAVFTIYIPQKGREQLSQS